MSAPTGRKIVIKRVTLDNTDLASASSGQLHTEDKIGIDDCFTTQKGALVLKEIIFYMTDTSAPTTAIDVDMFIFTNKATEALGLSAGSSFALNSANRNKYRVVSIDSSDFDTIDSTEKVARKTTDFRLRPDEDVQYSLSFCLVANASITYVPSTTYEIDFIFEEAV